GSCGVLVGRMVPLYSRGAGRKGEGVDESAAGVSANAFQCLCPPSVLISFNESPRTGSRSLWSVPDEAFVRNLTHNPKRISLADPRIDHAASCPNCTSQLMTLRQGCRSHQQRLVFVTAIVHVSLNELAIYHSLRSGSVGLEIDRVHRSGLL